MRNETKKGLLYGLGVGLVLTFLYLVPNNDISFIPKVIVRAIATLEKVIFLYIERGTGWNTWNTYTQNLFHSSINVVGLIPASLIIFSLIFSTKKWQRILGGVLVCIISVFAAFVLIALSEYM